ncbi:hypothetical protein QTP88_023830 [Uroleucon formosanum]
MASMHDIEVIDLNVGDIVGKSVTSPISESAPSQMKSALDAEFQEMIKNSLSCQESIGKNDKDKIMDA